MVKRAQQLLGQTSGWWRLDRAAAHALAGPRLALLSPRRPQGSPRRRRILFINQYYWPDHASTAQHLTDLAEAMAAAGYDCHVVCSRGSYQGDRHWQAAIEHHNGVTIHRLSATSLGRRNTFCRMADYLSFYLQALLHCLALPRCDVVATLTTPPLIGLVGTLLRRLKGSLHVCWSMDLHPDASVALGRMSARKPAVQALQKLSNAVYRRADKVVVLGPYMADKIAAKAVRGDRMATIGVWSRRDEVFPLPRAAHPLRSELGLEDKFIVMYSGNHGLAHSFDEILEAARRLASQREIEFLFVGDGPRRAEVSQAKSRWGLENVKLMEYFPRSQLHASLSLADVHLISMRREMTGVVVPGKLYGAMASARPMVFVGPDHCEAADTIRHSACGYTVRLGDVDGLIAAIRRLAADSELAQRMGEQGRSAFLAEHEKDVCCARWARMLGELVGAPRPFTHVIGAPASPAPQLSGSC